jgi:chemotaxis methyl-accepting protein methylase
MATHLLRAYRVLVRAIWNRVPVSLRLSAPGVAYGAHLHALTRLCDERGQSFGTRFLRNRAELELMCRLLEQNKAPGSSLDITVLGCSSGAEVYSIKSAIRSARRDLKVKIHAVDISPDILRVAETGIYSLKADNLSHDGTHHWSIVERMNGAELAAMFEVAGDQATVRSALKEGITWLCGNGSDPALARTLGPQDFVVANRFLCHMQPDAAENCLRNIARMVKPGGYLFVSGVDLSVRMKIAREMGLKPVTDLMREVHEGDPILRRGWPLNYWALEPFREHRPDWKIRYAAVLQRAG